MAKYELSDNVAKNILIFLGRVKFEGANNFLEIDAVQEIRLALSQPIVEEGVKDESQN